MKIFCYSFPLRGCYIDENTIVSLSKQKSINFNKLRQFVLSNTIFIYYVVIAQ